MATQIIQYQAPEHCYSEVIDFLDQRAAENNLLVGILENLKQDNHYYTHSNPVLLSIQLNKKVISVGVMTPPYNLILSETKEDHLLQLVSFLRKNNIEVPGVLAPTETAHKFAKNYADNYTITMHERIYQLLEVKVPTNTSGKFRVVNENDRDLAQKWGQGFA